MAETVKVGIIGCGTIGSEIARACDGVLRGCFRVEALYDIDPGKSGSLAGVIGCNKVTRDMDELIAVSDLVVEAAGAAAAPAALAKAIEMKRAILIMSVGGLLGSESLLEKARVSGVDVYLPSGAIAGLDGIKAASMAGIEKVTLTTRKPPKGLEGAPYLADKNINLAGISEDTVVFDGSAKEAVSAFPKNINVSAVLSLAGIGADKTRVRIVAVPGLTKNIHEVVVEGPFGVIRTATENVPSPSNPKTSYLAVLSAIAAMKSIAGTVKIGT
ncbi:MAG: aspartate dehydrogenase [Candidatus Omnitrophota bacterium]